MADIKIVLRGDQAIEWVMRKEKLAELARQIQLRADRLTAIAAQFNSIIEKEK